MVLTLPVAAQRPRVVRVEPRALLSSSAVVERGCAAPHAPIRRRYGAGVVGNIVCASSCVLPVRQPSIVQALVTFISLTNVLRWQWLDVIQSRLRS